ncbi:hypothetical protein [Comamonas faecalis]|uniref:hypothetical protein n=1 Tax=Comamonas faecalis TaxID=1387849 RepID=UPI0031EB576D
MQQKAALSVAHLVQATSMACGARLDCGFLLHCGHHEKIVNTLWPPRNPHGQPRLSRLAVCFCESPKMRGCPSLARLR